MEYFIRKPKVTHMHPNRTLITSLVISKKKWNKDLHQDTGLEFLHIQWNLYKVITQVASRKWPLASSGQFTETVFLKSKKVTYNIN